MKSVTSVFWYSLVICIAVVIWGSVAPIGLESFTAKVTIAVSDYFGWYYLLAVMVILAFCIYLILSRYGNIKLGKEKDEPEFSLPSWFAMLFSAGMGMGLVFWTTAEPISHAFTSTPGAEPGSDEAIRESLKYTFFHWGIHAWAVYGIVALVLAYFKFHKDQPGLISVTLMPIFGEKSMRGLSGKIIDVLSVFATVIGVAATLGFGSAQINGGMAFLFDTPDTFWMQLLILGTATAMFIASSWSGVEEELNI